MTATDLWNRVISECDELACEGLFFRQPFCFFGRARNYLRLTYKFTHEEAEDLAATVLAKAFKARHTFKKYERFEPWFWAVVNNTARDFLDSWARKHEVAMDHPSVALMPDPRAQGQRDKWENAAAVETLLSVSELSDIEQQVLILMFEGLSAEEVSEALTIDIKEVHVLRIEIRRKLTKGLIKMRLRRAGGLI